jgi:sulfatase modifying factor 1
MKKQTITLLLILTGFTSTYAQNYPEMVKIPGGSFTMGSNTEKSFYDEKPAHLVTISSFSMGKYEVTYAEYKAFCLATGNKIDYLWLPDWAGKDNNPVVMVYYRNAIEYCKWLSEVTGKNYRLPTEAEWEYAAGGGKHLYSGSDNINEVGWYRGNSNDRTKAVGKKKANGFGLYDMTGNVSELCSDWYGAYNAGDQTNPKGPYSGEWNVVRGGSWDNTEEDCQVKSRRGHANGDDFKPYIGFRVVSTE